MEEGATYRAMEGAVEEQFCDDDGNVDATKEQQREFLIGEGFSPGEVEEFLSLSFDEV